MPLVALAQKYKTDSAFASQLSNEINLLRDELSKVEDATAAVARARLVFANDG